MILKSSAANHIIQTLFAIIAMIHSCIAKMKPTCIVLRFKMAETAAIIWIVLLIKFHGQLDFSILFTFFLWNLRQFIFIWHFFFKHSQNGLHYNNTENLRYFLLLKNATTKISLYQYMYIYTFRIFLLIFSTLIFWLLLLVCYKFMFSNLVHNFTVRVFYFVRDPDIPC